MFGITKIWLTSREKDACEAVTQLILETGSADSKRFARRLTRTWRAKSGTDSYLASTGAWAHLTVWLRQCITYLEASQSELTEQDRKLLRDAGEALARIEGHRCSAHGSKP